MTNTNPKPPYYDNDLEHAQVIENRQSHLRGTIRYYHNRIRIHGEELNTREVLEDLWEVLTENKEEL